MKETSTKVELLVNGCAVWCSEVKEPTPTTEKVIRDAEDTLSCFEVIRSLKQEAFAVLSLNGANKPNSPARIVTLGLLDSNQVHPREVFADVIVDRAAAIILAHNHPSGRLEASPEDIAMTKRLVKAGEILGIRVLDHIILAPNGKHLSMKANGLM